VININTKNNFKSGFEKIKELIGFEGVVNEKKKYSKNDYYRKSYANALHGKVGN
jgi:hypothetical protein